MMRRCLPLLLASLLPGLAEAGKLLPEPPLTVVGTSQPLFVIPDLGSAVERDGKLVWREVVRIPDATFVKLHFVDVNLAPGDRIVVRDRTGRIVEELRGRGPRDMGTFWALSAFGDSADIELEVAAALARPPFRIDQAIAGNGNLWEAGAPGRSICAPEDFDDVFCYQSDAAKWENVMGSVGVMTVGGNPATGLWCSGSNVSPRNYLLTNYHCIGSQGDCTSAEFVFEYYRTGCNVGAPPTTTWQGFRCDTLQVSQPYVSCDQGLNDLDFSLSSVIGDPASAFGYVDPDPVPLTDGEAIYIIQHPAGRPHEIAHGSGVDVDVDGTVLRYYDTLDTEGGSSGSPIFRESDDLMVGLHHCGGCETPGVGNRGMLMSDIYPHIEPYLCTQALEVRGAGYTGLAEVTGDGDAAVEPGETWDFTPQVRNISCSDTALGVTAEIALNAGSVGPVTILSGTLSFGDVAPGAMAASTAPARFRLEPSAPCSGDVIFDLVNVTATNGGPFADDPAFFSTPSGEDRLTILFSDDFASGLANWTVVDGGTGTGPAATWTTANPGGRSLPLTAPFAIADSDALGSGNTMDEELIGPPTDASAFATVRLQFAHDFYWYSSSQNEIADVDVRSSATGGAWVNVMRYQGASASGNVVIDISAQAAGQSDVQVRFHYHDAVYEWWWAVDDVSIVGVEHVCDYGCPVIDIAPATLPDGYFSVPYSEQLTASGGTAPYTFTVSSGILPPGLTLTPTGLISGTPTPPGGTFPFDVTATDATGCTGVRNYVVTIFDCALVLVTPDPIPAGTEGVPYSVTMTASGGTPPYTWSTLGQLPPGLTLAPATGVLSGTPTAAGDYPVTIVATDAAFCTGYVTGMGIDAAVDLLAGGGRAQPVPNHVRALDRSGAATPVDFFAYAAGQWGANVGAGDLEGPPYAEILTGPGPGAVYGPQVRGFFRTGQPMAKVNFYAYATLRYGVNVASAELDADGFHEILSGAGPGDVFGPHVRAFNYDGVVLAAISKVNFFAYSTLRYGVNVEDGDIDADGFGELLTGPGPSLAFGATVRGFDYDGVQVTSIAKVNFNSHATKHGVEIAGGDVESDGYAEIAAVSGAGSANPFEVRGFDYDASAIVPLPGFTVQPSPGAGYGGRVGLGDLTGDGWWDLVAAAGADPSEAAQVHAYVYDGSSLTSLFSSQAFGYGYGAAVSAGALGHW